MKNIPRLQLIIAVSVLTIIAFFFVTYPNKNPTPSDSLQSNSSASTSQVGKNDAIDPSSPSAVMDRKGDKLNDSASHRVPQSETSSNGASDRTSKSESSPEGSQTRNPSDLENFLSNFDSSKKWTLKTDKSGIVRTAFGGIIPMNSYPSADFDKFVDNFLVLSGVPQTERKYSEDKSTKSDVESVYIFQQKINNIPVFNTIFKVIARSSDQGITYVINEFYPYTSIQSEENFNLDEVITKLRTQYASKEIVEINCESSNTYKIISNVAHLSKLCVVKVNLPMRKNFKSIVDLKDGTILEEIDVTIYN